MLGYRYGARVLAFAWGLDTRVLRTLDAVNLFGIHPEANVFVTLADALLAALTTLVTWAILTHLDGVFEVLVFPYLGWDEGVRYAVLTLSRYVQFFAGLVLALAAVHVSLASLQWILAAAGVGIGFGLQEVVSNFVCGINIRATTVENANYESMIIPNREFIVGKGINWTHQDTVTRVVLRVPVRYGTDLEKAKAIMQRAVREHPLVPKEPAPGVWLTGFGDKGLEFLVFVYASVPDHRPVIQEVLARIPARPPDALALPPLRPMVPSREQGGKSSAGRFCPCAA